MLKNIEFGVLFSINKTLTTAPHPTRRLTVFQLRDAMADGVQALVDLLLLALRLLPHCLTLLLQHLDLSLQFPLQVLHSPRALCTAWGGL